VRRKNPIFLALAPLLDTAGNVASIGAAAPVGIKAYKDDPMTTLTWLGIGAAVVVGLALIESSSQNAAAFLAPKWTGNPPGPTLSKGNDTFFLSNAPSTFVPGVGNIYTLNASDGSSVTIQCKSVDSTNLVIGGTIVASTNADYPSGGNASGIPWLILWGLDAT
jgi:hypothetical protein